MLAGQDSKMAIPMTQRRGVTHRGESSMTSELNSAGPGQCSDLCWVLQPHMLGQKSLLDCLPQEAACNVCLTSTD